MQNQKSKTLKYALATFEQAKQLSDTQRMADMLKVVLALYRKRGRLLIHYKKKWKEAKKQLKTEVADK